MELSNAYISWFSSVDDAEGKSVKAPHVSLAGNQLIFSGTDYPVDQALKFVTEGGNLKLVSDGPTYEMVDLGLSVLWANMNVGAKSETDFGDYFGWGTLENTFGFKGAWQDVISVEPGEEQLEITNINGTNVSVDLGGMILNISDVYKIGSVQGYDYYHYTLDGSQIGQEGIQESAFPCIDSFTVGGHFGTSLNIERSDYSQSPNVLPSTHDAASVKMGGSWRMPSKEELEELKNLPNELVENYKNSGHNGRVFTGNGNSIFVPAAGYWFNDGGLSDVGSDCCLWSSSLISSSPGYAWYLYFGPGSVGVSNGSRYYGYSVRGVCPKN